MLALSAGRDTRSGSLDRELPVIASYLDRKLAGSQRCPMVLRANRNAGLTLMTASSHRLRKHADYQRVYRSGRKQQARNMAYFYAVRAQPVEAQAQPAPGGLLQRDAQPKTVAAQTPPAKHNPQAFEGAGSRVGLTVPKALGNAVVRNRIKRRMREAVRHALPLLNAPVDLVLHPRRVVM